MTNEEAIQTIKHLIGTKYVRSVKNYIRELTGFENVSAPDDSRTELMISGAGHIAIQVNSCGLIERFDALGGLGGLGGTEPIASTYTPSPTE
ncbi:hypothetical protein HU742_000150 [Pseudomonas sp. SWRI102]|uniref:Uncharacterized protein n=1 Tax=Pseudomonas marvdashtae TaxID=2745500 RepID=A0A923FNE7_9PSED|nr:hypothetical protein [Pseudomonas marvdashtae]MBV4549559.1 hypothetical protein [Pseudomonas marvdashtae]